MVADSRSEYNSKLRLRGGSTGQRDYRATGPQDNRELCLLYKVSKSVGFTNAKNRASDPIARTIVWSLVKALWSLLNGIGNYDEAQRLFENRGPLLKALVQTPSFWPLAFLGLGLFLLAYIQFGSPRNWIRTSEEKKREQRVYDKTISDYAKQGSSPSMLFTKAADSSCRQEAFAFS